MSARALATVETIKSLHPIPDADAIVRARIRGWDVVVKRGEFTAGDLCVYVEVDAMLDVTDPRFAFLAPRGVRTDTEGRTGHVLKTAKLRGQVSQGLALPLVDFPEVTGPPGTDVTAALGVVKWDPPLPAQLAGQVRGLRPSWIPVTDEERIQNLPDMPVLMRQGCWVATEKIDGTSMSAWVSDDEVGVCSRNLDLIRNPDNTLWRLAEGIHEQLRDDFPGVPVVLQGEAYGEGIQGNPLKIRGQHFAAFTLRVGGGEVPRERWPSWVLEIAVPVLDLPVPQDVEGALATVDGLRSVIGKDRPAEGVVWRRTDSAVVRDDVGRSLRASVKVISNRYLLKHDR